MAAESNETEQVASPWTARILAGGAIGAAFAFYAFAFGSPVQAVAFLDPAQAAGAYATLWVSLWAIYLISAAALLLPLGRSEPELADARTVAFSAAAVLAGLTYLSWRSGYSDRRTYGLLLAFALTPTAYQLLAKRYSQAAKSISRPTALVCVMALFAAAAAYDWAVNYSSYSFEEGNAIRWAGLGLLLLCAAPAAAVRRRSVWTWLWTAGLAGLGLALFVSIRDSLPSGRPVGGSPEGPRHVVIITIDTLRADGLSCYRPDADATPNIDQLARDGTLFREAYSPASWTIPSMTSIFTGVSPLVHGVSLTIEDATLPTMADYFGGAGYDTVGIFGNPVLTSQRALLLNPALEAHFDVYHGFRNVRLFSVNPFGEDGAGQYFADVHGLDQVRGSNTEGLAALAVERFRAQGDGPSFLWAHFHDPHWPYSPPPEFVPSSPPPPPSIGDSFEFGQHARLGTRTLDHGERLWARALYQAEVGYVDEAVGRVLDALREAGAYEDALIVLTSDHGEEFWEHGRYGHGHSLHRESVLVPLIIKLPGRAQGQVVETPVENRALLPTLLELAKIPHEANASWAPSLVPLLQGTEGYDDSAPILTAGVELFENEAAIRVGDLRYIRRLYSGDEWMFDLATDPGETRSLLDQQPEEAERLRRALDVQIDESQHARKAMGLSMDPKNAFDEETLRRLKSLGYL